MLKKLLRRQEGFTIIEVMIVLAIAGLILVVVLVAVPQLQRNQRDSARKDVLARVSTELGVYASNNSGALPFAASGAGSITDFYTRYIYDSTNSVEKVDAKNPSTGNRYTLEFQDADSDTPSDDDKIAVYRGGKCDGENVTGTDGSSTARSYAMRLTLEGGTTYYCVDNQ